jgi:hypothetical protein
MSDDPRIRIHADEISIIKEAWQMIETHNLACSCAICTAYVKGSTPNDGIMQAADALRHLRGAGQFDKLPN